MKGIFFGALVYLLLPPAANATTIVIDAIDSGWYSSEGEHFSTNTNYAVGFDSRVYLRNFFVFDLSSVSGNVESAAIRLSTGAVGGSDTYTLFDITTAVNSLTDDHARGDPNGLLAYADLGSGITYGSTIIPNLNASSIDILLNADAVGALNAASDLFAVGGSYPASTTNRAFFSTSDANTRQLILSVIPTPDALTLLLLGLASLVYRHHRAG